MSWEFLPQDYPRGDVPPEQMPTNLEEWLNLHMNAGHIDFTLRAHRVNSPEGDRLEFYIHTQHLDSITYTFRVRGNDLETLGGKPAAGRIGLFRESVDMMIKAEREYYAAKQGG